ncbi:branched-chain amino acid ABC transporter permease [Isoalcanivorax beigongshangi]|uniref:Branched-chain amino acid ABC transporter permease n=1 Tax=Isoalcanivorax beigongshangi TaxID=3238810 RepID=A0ABV4AHV9_9GAMM
MKRISDLFASPWMKALLLAVALVFPWLAESDYQLYVLSTAFVWALAVYGLNIITGFCGQLNLGHGAFFALGAYTLAILTVDHQWPFWWAFAGAGLMGVVSGLVVGVVSLRLKENYFAIFTLCVGFIVYLLLDKWEALTHGAAGMMDIPAPEGFGWIDFSATVPFYYLALAFLMLGIWVAHRIGKSLLGRTFLAIRMGDDLAQSLGINLMRNKVLGFVLSTVYAAFAGALYASSVRFIGPAEADVTHTFDMIAYGLVGGLGTLMGPLVGTLLITWMTQSLQFLEEFRMIVFGPLLVVLVIFMPKGIVGTYAFRRNRRIAAELTAKARAKEEGQRRA